MRITTSKGMCGDGSGVVLVDGCTTGGDGDGNVVILDFGFWILGFGFWVLVFGFWFFIYFKTANQLKTRNG